MVGDGLAQVNDKVPRATSRSSSPTRSDSRLRRQPCARTRWPARQSRHAERDDVARLQVPRRLAAHPDARRRSGGDDVPRQQRHEPADVADEVRHAEDHRARVARCIGSPLTSSQRSSACGSAFVARHEPRSDRAEGVAALPRSTGRRARAGSCAPTRRDDAVAGHVIERPRLRHVLRLRATRRPARPPSRLGRAARMTRSSRGPVMHVVAFRNTIGSDGAARPASAAWSRSSVRSPPAC